MIACLKSTGTVDLEIHRLIRLVIGISRASRQDFRSLVGIKSREEVESEEAKIADF